MGNNPHICLSIKRFSTVQGCSETRVGIQCRDLRFFFLRSRFLLFGVDVFLVGLCSSLSTDCVGVGFFLSSHLHHLLLLQLFSHTILSLFLIAMHLKALNNGQNTALPSSSIPIHLNCLLFYLCVRSGSIRNAPDRLRSTEIALGRPIDPDRPCPVNIGLDRSRPIFKALDR